MDRGNCLYNMTNDATGVRGMHWYSKWHEDQSLMKFDLKNGTGASLNKRYLWLLYTDELGLMDMPSIRKWIIEPTYCPLHLAGPATHLDGIPDGRLDAIEKKPLVELDVNQNLDDASMLSFLMEEFDGIQIAETRETTGVEIVQANDNSMPASSNKRRRSCLTEEQRFLVNDRPVFDTHVRVGQSGRA